MDHYIAVLGTTVSTPAMPGGSANTTVVGMGSGLRDADATFIGSHCHGAPW